MSPLVERNRCNICTAVFGGWPEFNEHHRSTHGMFDRKVVPVKTSNRSKKQIVEGWEYANAKYLIF